MFDFELEQRLRRWAFYELELKEGNIGYPSKSVIVAFAEGGISPRHEAQAIIPILKYAEAQETSLWIQIMGSVYPDFENAIVLYYLTNKRQREIADFLNISTRRYQERIREAKMWLQGRMSAMQKKVF